MIFYLILWSLVIYGVTQIIAESILFKPLRRYVENNKIWFFNVLINCFLCVSVWVSAIMSALIYSPSLMAWPWLDNSMEFIISGNVYDLSILFILFADAMIGSAIAWLLHCLEFKLRH